MASVVNTCIHCSAVFRSSLGVELGPNIRLVCEGNRTECPACHQLTPKTDVHSVRAHGTTRLLPKGASATPVEKPYNASTVDEVYFTVGRNNVASFTWKAWKYKGDVYVSCREAGDWKISLHESGSDRIGFTAEAQRSNRVTLAEGQDRAFQIADRAIPYAAHAFRIARIVIESESNFEVPIKHKPLNRKALGKLVRVFPTAEGYVIFDFWYTEGHPALFRETEEYGKRSIGILQLAKNHYLSIVPTSEMEEMPLGPKRNTFEHRFDDEGGQTASFMFGRTSKSASYVGIKQV